MPKQLTRLTVFISGSSEVEAEKGALRAVVADLSEVLEKTHSLTLRLIGWPDTIRPGVGSDPQNVINEQVGDGYDIYVGVLGPRFGKSTPRAGSGTEEEFRHALSRFRSDTTSVRVLFYFNRTEQDPFALDLEQMQNVRNFRNDLSTEGVLYRDFRDTADFAAVVRRHLHALIVDEWQNERWREVENSGIIAAHGRDAQESSNGANVSIPPPAPEQNTGRNDTDEEELGLLELVEGFQRATEALTETLSCIAGHTTEIGHQFEVRTKQINQLLDRVSQVEQIGGSRIQQEYAAQLKDIADQSAIDLDKFANHLAADSQLFKIQNRAFFEHLGRTIIAEDEFGLPAERLQQERGALEDLIRNVTDGRAGAINFQAVVSRMPALTAKFKKARKRASATLGELIAELQFSIQEGTRILEKSLGNDRPVKM